MPYTNTLKNRAYNRHYMAGVYASRKAAGLCTQCGGPATEGVRCSGCAEKARVQARARISTMKRALAIYRHFRHGKWSCGWGKWDGKPRLAMGWTFYDCSIFYLHLGPFWAECDF